jgi:hypothetical protein
MNIKELYAEVSALDGRLKELLEKTEFEMYEDLSGVVCDRTDPEELFLLEELRYVMYDVQGISSAVSHLKRPVKAEGRLHRNGNGRYFVGDYELTCGYPVEYLSMDDRYGGRPYWRSSRLEHDGNDYYICADRKLELEGLQVRIRY